MPKILITLCLLSSVALARGGVVPVRGTIRPSGTYVTPHYRTAPDNTKSNNWSAKGNANPYNGKSGTKK